MTLVWFEQEWARSSAWLERSTDNRKVMSSNLIGPIPVLFRSGFDSNSAKRRSKDSQVGKGPNFYHNDRKRIEALTVYLPSFFNQNRNLVL